jgi:hypothetical protein
MSNQRRIINQHLQLPLRTLQLKHIISQPNQYLLLALRVSQPSARPPSLRHRQCKWPRPARAMLTLPPPPRQSTPTRLLTAPLPPLNLPFLVSFIEQNFKKRKKEANCALLCMLLILSLKFYWNIFTWLNVIFYWTLLCPGYDAAVYSAASTYYQQQQAAKAIGTWAAKKPGAQPFKPKPKGPPKTPQLHYCDVCKISCAGPQV